MRFLTWWLLLKHVLIDIWTVIVITRVVEIPFKSHFIESIYILVTSLTSVIYLLKSNDSIIITAKVNGYCFVCNNHSTEIIKNQLEFVCIHNGSQLLMINWKSVQSYHKIYVEYGFDCILIRINANWKQMKINLE